MIAVICITFSVCTPPVDESLGSEWVTVIIHPLFCFVIFSFRPGNVLRVQNCIRQIYTLDGLRGFYRGLSASYAGEEGQTKMSGAFTVHVYSTWEF